MWLNQLFMETPIDFEKRCKNRISLGICMTVLGVITCLLPFVLEQIPVLYMEPGWSRLVPGFYTGLGGGFAAAGIITVMKNTRYLKNPELKKSGRFLRQMSATGCWGLEAGRMLDIVCFYACILVLSSADF